MVEMSCVVVTSHRFSSKIMDLESLRIFDWKLQNTNRVQKYIIFLFDDTLINYQLQRSTSRRLRAKWTVCDLYDCKRPVERALHLLQQRHHNNNIQSGPVEFPICAPDIKSIKIQPPNLCIEYNGELILLFNLKCAGYESGWPVLDGKSEIVCRYPVYIFCQLGPGKQHFLTLVSDSL